MTTRSRCGSAGGEAGKSRQQGASLLPTSLPTVTALEQDKDVNVRECHFDHKKDLTHLELAINNSKRILVIISTHWLQKIFTYGPGPCIFLYLYHSVPKASEELVQ